MSRKKYFRVAAATAVLAIGLVACGGNGNGNGETEGAAGPDNPGGDPDAELTVALVSKGFQHQFWQAVKAGAEEAGEELGVQVTFEGPATETQVEDQMTMLQTAIDRSPDAIGLATLDPEACVPLLDDADAAGIPVVEFDADCNSEVPVAIARTDNVAAGALAADHMAELIGGSGQVGIVGHSQTSSTGVDRRDGFVDRIESEYPDIEIIDIQYGDGDHLRSADIAKAMLASNPDLAGLYATNEGAAIGVVNGVTELSLEPGELTIIGFDSGQAQTQAIRDGLMAGAITQDPVGMGRATIEAAVAAINDEEVEAEIDTGSYWYDAENIDDEDIAAMLYD